MYHFTACSGQETVSFRKCRRTRDLCYDVSFFYQVTEVDDPGRVIELEFTPRTRIMG